MNKSLIVAACLFAQVATAQTTVDVPIEEARVIATRALLAGDTDLALQIANALLARDPDDRAALLVVAASVPRGGDAEAGLRAAERAYWLSETPIQRYEAARLAALAATNQEKFTRATFWLRLALNSTPNEAERQRTLADARTISRRNPWSTNLSFGVVPSNNVNGGADENEVDDFAGLSGSLSADALALEGVRLSFSLSTRYRFYESQTDRATVGFRYQLGRVRLTDETVDNPLFNPDNPVGPNNQPTVMLDGDDFATDLVEVSLGYDTVIGSGFLSTQLAVGQFSFGLEPLYDYARFSIGRTVPLSDETTFQLNVRREWQDYESTGIDFITRTTLGGTLTYRLANGDRVSGGLTRVISDGTSSQQTFDETALQFGYAFAEPIGPVSLSVNAGLRRAEYPIFFGSADGFREDEVVTYGANIGFPGIEFAGFSPGLSLAGNNSDSNVGRFTRNTLSVAFTLNSAF